MPLRAGDVIDGKYTVERVLGAGGMGCVLAARHHDLDDLVALKVLLPEAAKSPEVVARFLREGRASAKIRSEHVVRVFDVGRLPTGLPYLVMEYLEGEDLAQRLVRLRQFSVEETVECVVHACEPVALAHAAGIVHRDLKPGNLFRVERSDGTPCIKVLDFGISKFFASTDPTDFSMTRSRVTMGSPLYVAPEQMSSARDVDARTDIWALGVILFELLTGVPPFQGEDIPQLCAQILQSPPLPLRTLRPDVPERLEAIVLRCLAKDRAQRFERVGELAEALLEFAPTRARSIAERVVQIGAAELAHAATLPSSPPNVPSVPAVGALQRPPSVRVATRFVPAPLESIPSPMARTRDGADGRDSVPEPDRRTRWITLGVAVAAVATLGVAWRVRQGAELAPAMAADVGKIAAQAPLSPMPVPAAPREAASGASTSVQGPSILAKDDARTLADDLVPPADGAPTLEGPGGTPTRHRSSAPAAGAPKSLQGTRTPAATEGKRAPSGVGTPRLDAPKGESPAARTSPTPIPDDRK